MGIRMIPPGFPEHRRRDPKRRAEARLVDVLEKVRLNGWTLYEFRYRRGGKQVDLLLWIDRKGRFAVQVKGGRYEMDEDGQWFLIKPDGTRSPVPCPFEETEDGCMEMKNAIEEAVGFTHFVAGVTVFPDMERDARVEEVARRRHHVYVIWGLDHLQEDLERIAVAADFKHKPKPSHSENESRRVNELQYRGPEDQEKNDREMPGAASGQAKDLEVERQLILGSATINIHQVNTLVIQQGPPEQDIEGQTYMCGL